ncbi:MAG: type II toxin-antitoxin system RelE/ParE family toxin [Bosea sp. (in: a-proteobacteria)]
MRKVVWTVEALRDRDAIYDHIEQDNPAAALALDARFSAAAQRLADHPALGRPGRVHDTRELVAHENYVLIYDLAEGGVRILRLLHAARQWPPKR